MTNITEVLTKCIGIFQSRPLNYLLNSFALTYYIYKKRRYTRTEVNTSSTRK